MESSYYGTGRQEVLPASQFLQERLQERRARNLRPKRARQSDLGPRRGGDDDIFLDEAEASRARAARMFDSSPLVAGSVAGSDMGQNGYHKRPSISVKDLDVQLDKLNKQNFALKLELNHRRQQTQQLQDQIEGMQVQFERAERLEQEHTQLLEINTKLVEELEKRDRAVEEAMDIICELEDKVADMEERRSQTRPSTAQADSGYAGTETHEQVPPSSPPELVKPTSKPPATRYPPPAASAASNRLQSLLHGPEKTPDRMRREPSFMSQKKSSTHALRSVYLENAQSLHPVQSFNSLLSKRDSRLEGDNDILNSPRLSTLSESSFPSLYSPKKHATPDFAWKDGQDQAMEDSHPHYRQDSINRVSRWIDRGDSDLEDTPSKVTRAASPLSQRTARGLASRTQDNSADDAGYQSLDEAGCTEQLQPATYRPYCLSNAAEQQRERSVQVGNVHASEQLLPPTPNSVSMRMLRSSCSTVDGERSLLDTTPAVVRGYDPLQPGMRTAPKQMRSSIELNSAYVTNMQFLQDAGGGNSKDDTSSDDEDYGADAHLVAVNDLGLNYGGFPDGNSIIMGTPSRFLKHGKPPSSRQPSHGNAGASPPQPIRRRLSSSDASPSPRKPSLGRAETSPTFLLGSLGRNVSRGSKATIDSAMSGHTHHSGSSSSRTVVQGEPDRNTSLSPGAQTSVASPSRSISQRTQKLLRRLSNSHSEKSEQLRSPTLRTALPTLTSTPSSAYVRHGPKEVRRPSTSCEKSSPAPSSHQHVRLESGRRPSLTSRTKTEPAVARPPLATTITTTRPEVPEAAAPEKEKKPSIFKRRDSSKNASTPPPAMLNGSATKIPTTAPEGAKEAAQKKGGRRRGSIREAVASKKPWR